MITSGNGTVRFERGLFGGGQLKAVFRAGTAANYDYQRIHIQISIAAVHTQRHALAEPHLGPHELLGLHHR